MNAEVRLAEIVSALEEVRLSYLIMGGHAARYYGIQRNTIDYDLHLSLDAWDDLPAIVARARLFAGAPLIEGPTWRPQAFRRFLIGRLPDGREEWLEFWRRNHLLPPFAGLFARREDGTYGGRQMAFFGLPDLIRSKETEGETDWQDIAQLEEILDARNLARAADRAAIIVVLSELRSRRGFQRARDLGHVADRQVIAEALAAAQNPISRAYLVPFVKVGTAGTADPGMIGEILSGSLRKVTPGSARHFGLVEAVRRLYKQAAIAADRVDKQAAMGS